MRLGAEAIQIAMQLFEPTASTTESCMKSRTVIQYYIVTRGCFCPVHVHPKFVL